MTSDMYLRIKQVTALTGLSRATIYNMMAAGSFPMKTALGIRAVGWLSSEIQVWMAGRKLVEKQGREAAPAKRRAPSAQRLQKGSPAPSTQPTTVKNVSSTSLFGWEDADDAVPTAEEADAIRNRLRLLRTKKTQQGTGGKVASDTIPALSKGRRTSPSAAPSSEHKTTRILEKKKT